MDKGKKRDLIVLGSIVLFASYMAFAPNKSYKIKEYDGADSIKIEKKGNFSFAKGFQAVYRIHPSDSNFVDYIETSEGGLDGVVSANDGDFNTFVKTVQIYDRESNSDYLAEKEPELKYYKEAFKTARKAWWKEKFDGVVYAIRHMG